MANSSVYLQFQRPDGRSEFDRTRRDLKSSLLDQGTEAAAGRLSDLGAALDTGVTRLKRELLGTSLCWNDDNQALARWISQQHRALAEMATRVVTELRREGNDETLVRQMMALTFFQWGEAVKWTMWRERHDFMALHGMLAAAIEDGRHRQKFMWTADGRGKTTTLEALYFRALLLDRFTSGSLTSPQVAIAEAWLWEWTNVLTGVREYPGGDVLRVDLDTPAGLREGEREGEGDTLYLRLEPLEAERRKIIAELHRGNLVPAHGAVAEIRLEEHICVLDHLRAAFRGCVAGDSAQRAPRQSAGSTRLEVWVGLPEILSRGIGVGTETGRYRALNLSDPAIEAQSRARFNEATKRYLWLVDASATGHGLEALESDAQGIEVGDLLGWRNTTNGPIVLARVMRRMPAATSGQVFLGVQLLTEAAQPLKLTQVVSFDNGSANGTYLFVPGSDDSGAGDGFLVSDHTYGLQASYSTHVGAEAFKLKFNRVRIKGRGWNLAGFEILTAESGPKYTPAESEPEFTLVFEDTAETVDDPWRNEVAPRLLS